MNVKTLTAIGIAATLAAGSVSAAEIKVLAYGPGRVCCASEPKVLP